MSKKKINDSLLEERAKVKKMIDICECFDFPTAIFNSESKCIYCKNDLIDMSSEARSVFKEDYFFEDLDYYTTIFIIKGVQYCAKIYRVDGYYVCGLFNSHQLGSMARYTDFAERMLSSVDVIQSCFSRLWRIMTNLRSQNITKPAADMEVNLLKINRLFQSILEYLNMVIREPRSTMIDCMHLVNVIVKRTNTLLSKCGRRIDIISNYEKSYYIEADMRHTIAALVSVIQNSLMYSKKDYVPCITLDTISENRKDYVIIKIVNESSYFTENYKALIEEDFLMNKFPCGIPILKRFAEETEGEFTLNEVEGIFTALLKIPSVKNYSNVLFFECDDYTYFETGIPDFLELKIGEVVELFSDDT